MGVRGLKTFLDKNGGSKMVKIEDEIRMWKRRNPNATPIIVFDILGFCYMDNALVCGGGGIKFDVIMEKFFIRLQQNGAKLVFIQDMDIDIDRVDLWMSRRDDEFQTYVKIHEDIVNGKPASEIVQCLQGQTAAWKVSVNLIPIASKYGEYLFTRPGRDCDHEVALYAQKHDAMAIFTADTDFMVFKGNWKFWWLDEIDFDMFAVKEYDRLQLNRLLYLTFDQRPLFATLIGNDFTKKFYEYMNSFHRSLGRTSEKFHSVARFIRQNFKNEVLYEDDIDFVATEIFGDDADDDKRRLIADSIKSYELDVQDEDSSIEDPIRLRLQAISIKATEMYVKMNIHTIQTVTMTFNNMITAELSENLIQFMVELLRKKMGILNPDNREQTFELITKKSREECFAIHQETAIYPECAMPLLIDLLTNGDSDDQLNQIRWKLLAWMLSISDDHRDALRTMEKDFRVACATLLALVQRHILTVRAADGILVTLMAIRNDQINEQTMPNRLDSYYVRAAHTYRTVSGEVFKTFFAAGLIRFVPEKFNFDGVYYQNLMASNTFPADALQTIERFRIYV